MATYAEIGIHLDDARRTTERLEEIVARARGAGVLADVGAFGGMFRLGAAANSPTRCWWPRPTASAPR